MHGISTGAGFGSFGSIRNTLMPSQNNLNTWLKSATTDGKTLTNVEGTNATLTGINSIAVTSGDTITITGLSSSTSVSSVASGSVTPTVSSNTLTFGSSGFCSNIVLSDGTHLPLAEGGGTKVFDISGNGNHGTLSGTSWTNTNSIASHNHQYGFSKKNYFPAGTMELGTTFSKDNATTAYNTSIVYQGNTSLQIQKTFNASNYNQGYIYSTFTTDSTGTYTISARVKGTAGQKFSFAIFNQTDGGFALTRGSSEKTLTGEWDLFSDDVSLTKDKVYRFYFALKDFNQVVYVDDARAVTTTKSPALINKTKQAVTFDGANTRISYGLGSFNTSAWTVKFNITTDTALSNEGNILGQEAGTGTARLWLRIFGVGSGKLGRVVTFLGGSGETQLAPDGTIVANTNYDFELIYNGSGSLQLKTTTGGTTTTHPAVSRTVEAASGNLIFGDSHVGGQAGIIVTARSFEVEGLTKSDFEQGIGTTTITDISGQSNNGTVANATLSSFWGKRYVDSDGSIVVADYAVGTTSVFNPSGYVHNGSECGLDLITTDVSASDIASINNASATQTFAKRDATNSELVTQLLQYSSTISGGDLVRTRRYVG